MKTYRIYNINNKLLHEGEAESLKEFVENRKTDLSGANLRFANLNGADLSEANLSVADLSEANLSKANLIGANLNGADLQWANLDKADLKWANLIDTKLRGTNLPIYSKNHVTFSVKSPNATIENISLNDIQIKIGCKEKSIPEWDRWFDSEEEYETKRGTFEFRQIEAHYEAVKAYLTKLYGG